MLIVDIDHPAVARAMAERRELMRRAYVQAIARADAGQDIDPVYLQCARDFVAANAPLDLLSDGSQT